MDLTVEIPDDWPQAAQRKFVDDLMDFIDFWEQPPADLAVVNNEVPTV